MRSKILQLVHRARHNQPFTITGRLLTIAFAFCFLAIIDDALAALLSYLFWLLIFAFGCGLAIFVSHTPRIIEFIWVGGGAVGSID